MSATTTLLLGLLLPCALVVVPLLARASMTVARATARAGGWRADRLRQVALRAGVGRVVGAALGVGTAAANALPASAAAVAAPASAPEQGSVPAPVLPLQHRAPGVHVVRPGESLWSIAADHLGPRATDAQVAAAWPRWYRANRRLVGPDPSLLRVGVRLRPPSSARPAPADGAPRHHPSTRTTGSTSSTDRRTGTSASPHRADPTPARPVARPTVRADSLDPDRR